MPHAVVYIGQGEMTGAAMGACIYTEKLTVFNAYEARRTDIDFAVGFRDDLDEARRLIVGAVRGVVGVLEDPASSAIYTGVGAHGVTVRARWWTDSKHGDELAVRDRVVPAVVGSLSENGIEIVYPTQHVLFHDQTEEVDGDVPRQRRVGDALSRLAESAARGGVNGDGSASDAGTERRG